MSVLWVVVAWGAAGDRLGSVGDGLVGVGDRLWWSC